MKYIFTLFTLYLISSFNLVRAQTYLAAGSLNKIRDGHEGKLLNNGNVLVFGGYNGYGLNPYYYRSAEIYTRSTNSWTYTDSMAEARTDFASVILNDGRVLAIGGSNLNASVLSTCEWYDPLTKKWSGAPAMNVARSFHKAIVLPGGKVFVAGGYDNSCELFDPTSNKWTITSPMVYTHLSGMSMVMLTNGKLLALGGTGAKNKAELYDPFFGVWTAVGDLNSDRVFSNVVASATIGYALVYGSTESSGMQTAEYFNNNTSSFNSTASMGTMRSNSPGILLDDDRILTYGLGDFFAPIDTKAIEVFGYSTGWSSPKTNFIGTSGYTISKLTTGEILVSGGNATTGNGASATCLLILPTQNSGCTLPLATPAVSTTTPTLCYGKDGMITIKNTESSVSYKAMINSQILSYAIQGGGDINISIPFASLGIGKNVIRIFASKYQCNGIILDQTAAIAVTQSYTVKPQIIVKGSLTTCSGTPLTLSSSITAAVINGRTMRQQNPLMLTKHDIIISH
jgi:hypothetical protein